MLQLWNRAPNQKSQIREHQMDAEIAVYSPLKELAQTFHSKLSTMCHAADTQRPPSPICHAQEPDAPDPLSLFCSFIEFTAYPLLNWFLTTNETMWTTLNPCTSFMCVGGSLSCIYLFVMGSIPSHRSNLHYVI